MTGVQTCALPIFVNGPGEAAYTDMGFTGGGAGSGMMYFAGKAEEKVSNETMVDRIVDAVEEKAAKLKAEREAAEAASDAAE